MAYGLSLAARMLAAFSFTDGRTVGGEPPVMSSDAAAAAVGSSIAWAT